ncbi:MAG: methylated-DNA--[protein]-cysteine S-methyltransferase, partial [Gammaproteobacteria bacterium]
MPFVIHWVDDCNGPERLVKANTPASVLNLTLRGDVIVEADWDRADEANPGDEHPITRQLNRYWLDVETPVFVKLLRQGSAFRNRVWLELCR